MLTLHGYWRSSAAYRVRIALNLKGLPYEQVTHDLRTGAQKDAAYFALAPHGLVPALETGMDVIVESPAILEWLEDHAPAPTLLPADPAGRAVVRAMSAIIACDIHPLNNLRVLQALRNDFSADPASVDRWIARWIVEGFSGLERLIARHGGNFAYGDAPTLADCCLVPQVYSAERFKIDLTPFPALTTVASRARELSAIKSAHPDQQPDADRP